MVQDGTHNNCIRWLHLSDFHTGSKDYSQEKLFEYLLKEITRKFQEGSEPDLVFITGDIAHGGKQEEYNTFYEKFLARLIEMFPEEGRIFTIPGNHDVDIKEAEAVQRYGIQERLPHFLFPNHEGFHVREPLLSRFKAYSEFDITETDRKGKHWLQSEAGFYTNCKLQIKGRSIGILGINTAWFCGGGKDNEDRFQLTPGKAMLEEGLEVIKDCDIRIVLGHHPIDTWFIEAETPSLRALLARYNVLYLHGHLHENTFRPEIGAGREFLTIMAGASYQAREHNLWVNSFLWCELDYDNKYLYLEPRQWSRNNQEWSIGSANFPEKLRVRDENGHPLAYWGTPLPELAEEQDKTHKLQTWNAPTGWEHITPQFLDRHAGELTDTQLLQFFNGRLPEWQDALSSRIPERQKVSQLLQILQDPRHKDRTHVTLLLGAAGEGKSVMLRQVVCNLVKADPTRHVWWNTDAGLSTQSLIPAIQNLPRSHTLLIVSDEADVIADKVYDAVKFLLQQGKKNIQFLLCCQPIAWREVEGRREKNFGDFGREIFVKEDLHGLSLQDAEAIADAWSKCGTNGEGLGKLKDLAPKEAAQQLYAKATLKEGSDKGSFFGAILAARYGNELDIHIEDVLNRLQRKGKAGEALLKALSYIAAVHVLDTVRLSRNLLATLLNRSRQEVLESIIKPLGDEAFLSLSRDSIYTRHLEIARMVVQILAKNFSFDFEQIYVDLIQAARRAYNKDRYRKPPVVPDIGNWNNLPDWFFFRHDPLFDNIELDNKRIGLLLAQALIDVEQDNPVFYSKLANFYRKDEDYETSAEIMRENFHRVIADREYYYEWGTCEGQAENHHIGAWLDGISLADGIDTKRLGIVRIRQSLAGVAIALMRLFEKETDPVFLKGSAGTVRLGLSMDDKDLNRETRSSLERSRGKCIKAFEDAKIAKYDFKNIPLHIALEHMQNAVSAAYLLCGDESAEEPLRSIPEGNSLTFHKLASELDIQHV